MWPTWQYTRESRCPPVWRGCLQANTLGAQNPILAGQYPHTWLKQPAFRRHSGEMGSKGGFQYGTGEESWSRGYIV